MLDIIAVGLLLIITIFLVIINWKIYLVTIELLKVTIDIHSKTIDLFIYTRKTYEILGGDGGLTSFGQNDTMEEIEEVVDGIT